MAFIFKDQVEALAGSTTSTEAERWFDDGIKDVIEAYNAGRVKDEDRYYNMRIMKKIFGKDE